MEWTLESRRLRALALIAGGVGAGMALLPSDGALARAAGAFEDGFLPGFVRLLYSGFLCF